VDATIPQSSTRPDRVGHPYPLASDTHLLTLTRYTVRALLCYVAGLTHIHGHLLLVCESIIRPQVKSLVYRSHILTTGTTIAALLTAAILASAVITAWRAIRAAIGIATDTTPEVGPARHTPSSRAHHYYLIASSATVND
jgi:hypothetical protein